MATATEQQLIGAQRKERSEFKRAWSRFIRYRPAIVSLVFLFILTLVALFPSVFAPYSPTETFSGMRGGSPTMAHPLGFDNIGRDLLSRMIHGARVALIVGLLATVISSVIGVTIGAVAGYFGSWIDSMLSRVVDALMAFPLLVLLIALVAVIGPGLNTIVFVLGITVWAPYARVVRADTMSLRDREFVIAARTIGAPTSRIIARHIVPNVMAPVVILASLSVGSIIILESALSFLGLGIQPPLPSWGGILSEGRPYIRQFPHITVVPGIMITITVLAFNFIGEGLRDALDPRGDRL